MNKKNKASKLISTALGLIVIFAVILCSPLFGYGRGLAPKEQREAAAAAEPGFSTGYVAAPQAAAAATPRPTAQPTQAPVVLPSAPPVPDPTPEPTRPPSRPAAVQQAAQPVQQQWLPEEAAEGEGEYDESSEETPAESVEMPANTIGIGEEITTTEDGSQYIATQNADIVINTGAADSGGAEQSYESSNNPPTQEFVPDFSEAEAFTIG